MQPIPRAQLVYFPLTVTADAETPFPPAENLIGDVEIIGLGAYSVAQLAATPDGATVVSAADALKLTVTLFSGSDGKFIDIPYSDLIRAINAGLWYEFVPFVCDITKCRVKTNVAATGPVNVAFLFYYRLVSSR